MIGSGTSVYSVLYYGAALVVLLFTIRYLIRVWRPAIRNLKSAMEKGEPVPSVTKPVVKTIVTITFLIVVLTVAWNLKQSVTTSMSTYKSPAEIAEQKKVEESKLPEKQTFDKVKAEMKERSETKPHEDAFKSFNENMKEEAEKIKKRSLGESLK